MKSKKKKLPKQRCVASMMLAVRSGNHAGKHHNRDYDVLVGRSRNLKHKGKRFEE
tara:strand:- start:56321 stop:56485 length:165 start_codon:yes stop_codon:yes gene_type:complete